MNKHFNKNLIISEEEEHLFQQSNSCWICKNVTGKFRGAAHWDCKFSIN